MNDKKIRLKHFVLSPNAQRFLSYREVKKILFKIFSKINKLLPLQ